MGYNGKTHFISNLKNVSYVNHTRAVEVRGLPFDAIIENDILSPIGFKTRHTRIHSCVSHDKGMDIYDVVWLRNGRTCKNTIILDLVVLCLLLMLFYVVYRPIWISTYGDLNIGNEGLKYFGLCYFYRATPTVPDTEPRLYGLLRGFIEFPCKYPCKYFLNIFLLCTRHTKDNAAGIA